jgi:hypothetical protein
MSAAGDEYIARQDKERPRSGRPGLERKVDAIMGGMHGAIEDGNSAQQAAMVAIAELLALLLVYGLPREG